MAAADIMTCTLSESLPRERFWDVPVSKIDSPTRQPLLPRSALRPCRFAAPSQARRWLRTTPQMARRDFLDAYFVFPLALVPRTTEIQCGLIATGD